MESPSVTARHRADDSCQPQTAGVGHCASNPAARQGFLLALGPVGSRSATRGTPMEEAFRLAAIWLALAVLSTIIASHLRISMALVEICVGMAAAFLAGRFFSPDAL